MSEQLTTILNSYSLLPHSEEAKMMTTVDISTPRGRMLCQRALALCGQSLWDMKEGTVLTVQDIIAHYSEYVNDEGEEVKGPMMTLIAPDGTAYHTGSKWVFRQLQVIAGLLGKNPPWIPPIRIQPMRQKSRSNREYQTIVMIEDCHVSAD